MNEVNYVRRMPKDKWKRVEINKNITVMGLKSMSYDYDLEKYPLGKLNNNEINLSIKTKEMGSSFNLEIHGRENILKLKEAVDFALEIDKEQEEKI